MGLTIQLWTSWMFLCVASVSSQKLTLSINETEQKTPCTQPLTYGMRYGIPNPPDRDVFWFRGILDATGVNLTEMSPVVSFQMNRNNAGFNTICGVTLSTPCSPTPIDACYCSSQNNQVYNMVYSDYAGAGFVHADIQIRWNKIDGSFGIASNVISMPLLYDITKPELTVLLNGQNYPISGQLSRNCSFSLIAGQANKLELIPSKAARPFYMEISSSTSDGLKSSNKSTDYVSITVTPANLQVTTEFKLTYSMCVPGNYSLGSCVASSVVICDCCEEICCEVSEADLVLGCVLFVTGVVLAILLCLEKIPRIILVKVYTGASIACGAVSLIIGAISTSEHCDDNCTSKHCNGNCTSKHCDNSCCQQCEEEDSLKDCPLGIVSAVLIGACAVTTVLGVALLIYHCCHKKKWKSDFPGGSSSTELATNTNRHNNGSSRNN